MLMSHVTNKTIAVVIPIYNTKEQLPKCIESVINQTYHNLEIILIDDGSTDGSDKVCDAYEKEDDRIHVIHQENMGLVASRRVGAIVAKADYVSYLDSDDWIDKTMYEELSVYLDKDDSVDLITSNTFMERDSTSFCKTGTVAPGTYDGNVISAIIPGMMRNPSDGSWGIVGSAVAKIYKKTILIEVLKNIDDRITYGEDDALVFSFIPRCNKVVITDKCFYHYIIHSGSMGTSFSLDSFFKLQLLKDFFEREFKALGIWEQQKSGVNQFLLMFLTRIIKSVYGLDIGYQFPFEIIPPNSKIVLYGAGVVGKCYYNSVKTADYCKVEMWADKNYESLREQGYEVSSPEEIIKGEFDYLLVAVEGKDSFENIKNELIVLGIPVEKIVWRDARLVSV